MTFYRIMFVAALGVLIAGVAYWLWNIRPYAIRNIPSSGEQIVAFGDSLTVGQGVEAGKDFASILSQKIGRPVLNAGWSGDTTRTAIERLQADVLARNPKIVIVLLGGNDFLRRVPKDETFKNLSNIVDKIHEKGAAVLLLGIRGGIFADHYKNDFKRLAREKQTAFISDILEGVIGHPQLMSDPIHPNEAGYALMAERIAPVLEELLR